MLYYLKAKAIISLMVSILFIQACSSPQPPNKWQHDAVAMSQNYQKHFLQNRLLRARLELNHARRLASQSAKFHTLIDIELTSCAMQLGSLEKSACEKATELLLLEPDPFQYAYLKLLTSQISEDKITFLPRQYQDFARALINADQSRINQTLLSIRPLSSRLIASALAIEDIDDKNISELIDKLSFHGYKKPLLAWLNIQMKKEKETQEKARLRAKIDVLTSN